MYIYTKRLNRVLAQSCPTLCELWTVVHQAPPSMEFSRQDYWSGLPFPSLGDCPNPGIKPGSPASRADALPSDPPGKTNIIGDILLDKRYMCCHTT